MTDLISNPPHGAEELKKWYAHAIAALSEGFCPTCKTSTDSGYCDGVSIGRNADGELTWNVLHPASWWHICKMKEGIKEVIKEPLIVQTYDNRHLGVSTTKCENCGKVFS